MTLQQSTLVITHMQIIPVAGHDSILLSLSRGTCALLHE